MTLIPITDLFKEAERLETSGQSNLVPDLYKGWLALNPNDGLQHAAYFNYSVALSRVGDRAGAINALRACIRMKPDFLPPYLNLGRLLEDSGQTGAAVAQWLEMIKALGSVNGDSVRHKLLVLQQTGRVLENAHCDAAAEDALRQALDLDPEQPEAAQHWIALRQRQCKWPSIEGWEGVPAKKLAQNISPLSAAIMLDDPLFQLARGYRYARDTIGIPETVIAPPVVPRAGRKLRIGYVSSDLREHAVGFGLAEVMELHDRQRYEIHAYYCGIARTDPTQARIKANVDSWTDINPLDDDAAARRIAEDRIDILIDLNGYTRDARTSVFARRPAPVIANWFGFPGTMATPYHHYIIADDAVIPEGDEIFYTEKVLRLDCYQPNDRKRPVAERAPTRAEEGLPEDAFVFCCLNGSQKITPAIFKLWMEVLRRVPGSVLWLLSSSTDIDGRLRQMAEQHGIAASRLIFADKKPNPVHLARYPLADLFLDTHPYGAHTTAADALWMGVPILTIPGATFASRVCADVVRAAGQADLVCGSPAEYVLRAVDFGLDREKARAVRRTLLADRESSVLFDTSRLVRRLEGLFDQMWDDAEADAIPVPDLTNLDVYNEIGLDLSLLPADGLAPGGAVEQYRARLERWHRGYPLKADSRLWDGG